MFDLAHRIAPRRLAAFMLLALLAVFCGMTCREPAEVQPPAPEAPPTVKVVEGRIQVLVRASGALVPEADVVVKSTLAGKVKTVHCELGGDVKKGAILIDLESDAEDRGVRRADAALKLKQVEAEQARSTHTRQEAQLKRQQAEATEAVKQAQARVSETETQYKAKQELYEKQKIEKTELDLADTNFKAARQALQQALAQQNGLAALEGEVELARQESALAQARQAEAAIGLEEAKARQAATHIAAPMDGVVVEKNVQPGQLVASALSNGGGPALLCISNLSRIHVVAAVAEADVGLLANNLSAQAKVAAFPKREFKGRIVAISPRGKMVNGQSCFDVRIEIEGGDAVQGSDKDDLRPGMTAKVEIVAKEKAGVLLAPVAAVVVASAKGAAPAKAPFPYVNVRDAAGATRPQPVKLGLTDGVNYEVLEGLKVGQDIVLPAPPAPASPAKAPEKAAGSAGEKTP